MKVETPSLIFAELATRDDNLWGKKSLLGILELKFPLILFLYYFMLKNIGIYEEEKTITMKVKENKYHRK